MDKSNIKGVLESLKEVIISQQGIDVHEPTPSEFYAIILASISNSADNSHLVQLLEIVDAVILQTSQSVVRATFKQLSSTMLNLCRLNVEISKVLRLCLTILAKSLSMQENTEVFWRSKEAMMSFNALLKMIDDPKVKLRKAVQEEILKLFSLHKSANFSFVRKYFADFCMEIVKTCTKSDYRRTLHVIIFLESVLCNLCEDDVVKLVPLVLRLQDCEQAVLTVEVFRMLDAFFQSNDSLSSQQLLACLVLIFNGKPTTNDMETITYFCTLIGSGLSALYKVDKTACCAIMHQGVRILISKCEVEFAQVHCAIGSSLKRLLTMCVESMGNSGGNTSMSSEGKGKRKRNESIENEGNFPLVIAELERAFLVRYQAAWVFLLDAVQHGLFGKLQGPEYCEIVKPLMLKLGEICEAFEDGSMELQSGLQLRFTNALGAALRTSGLKYFLTIFPLLELQMESTPPIQINQSKLWIFHVLVHHLRSLTVSYLEEFSEIINISRILRQNLSNSEHLLTHMQINESKRSITQLWSLFPQFCASGVADIVTSFPKFSPILLAAMKDENYPELLSYVASGLSNLIRGVVSRYEPMNIRQYLEQTNYLEKVPDCPLKSLHAQCGSFLPVLMNLLDGMQISDPRFQNIVECVTAFASISPQNIILIMAKKLLKLLLSASSNDVSDNDTGSTWMIVTLSIVPYLPASVIQLLYRTIRPTLSSDENISLQKRAFRVLGAMLKSHGKVLLHNSSESPDGQSSNLWGLLEVLSHSVLTSHVSARFIRLGVIEDLFAAMDEDESVLAFDTILHDVLVCQKDANKKTRDAAISLFRAVINRIPYEEIVNRLVPYVNNEKAQLRSSSVLSLCLLFLELRDNSDVIERAVGLLPAVFNLLQSGSMEEAKAFLQYVKVCIIVLSSHERILELFPLLSEKIFSVDNSKGKFLARIRGIVRKVLGKVGPSNHAYIRSCIPTEHHPLMDYILRQSRKLERKKLKGKVGAENSLSLFERAMMSDSDDSAEDDVEMDRRSFKSTKSLKKSAANDDDDVAMNEDFMAVDPRFTARAKAQSAKDVASSSLPTTLDDLMDDQTSSLQIKPRGRIANDQEEHSDNDYTIKIDDSGKIVVRSKSNPLEVTANMRDAINDVAMKMDDATKATRYEAPPAKKARVREFGDEYRAKKGTGGDVWKHGKLEPYAFIPLDGKMLAGRNTGKAVQKLNAVFRNNKKDKTVVSGKRLSKEDRKILRRENRRAEEDATLLAKHGLTHLASAPRKPGNIASKSDRKPLGA